MLLGVNVTKEVNKKHIGQTNKFANVITILLLFSWVLLLFRMVHRCYLHTSLRNISGFCKPLPLFRLIQRFWFFIICFRHHYCILNKYISVPSYRFGRNRGEHVTHSRLKAQETWLKIKLCSLLSELMSVIHEQEFLWPFYILFSWS